MQQRQILPSTSREHTRGELSELSLPPANRTLGERIPDAAAVQFDDGRELMMRRDVPLKIAVARAMAAALPLANGLPQPPKPERPPAPPGQEQEIPIPGQR